MGQLDLRELDFGAPLQLAPLEDSRHLRGDGAEEIDVPRVELAPLGALDVEDSDQARTGLDGHRGHGVEAVLVQPWDPLPVRLLADVGHDGRPARLRDPAGDALPHLHRHLADHVLVEAVGRGEQQLAAVRQHQIERTDVGADGRSRLADDQLEQLIRALG